MEKDDEDKLVNAIIDLHKEIKLLRWDMDKQLAKVNLSLGELRLSYMKLDESFNKYAKSNKALIENHEMRIIHLEDKTGGAFIAREPKTAYKRKKK